MAKYIDATRGLMWVRLDCAFPRNPKVLELVSRKQWRAICAYIGGLSYSGEHGLDGWLPEACLPFIHATSKDASELVRVGLWLPEPGGWDINDWDQYQATADEVQARRTKAKRAAEERWKRERAKKVVTLHQTGEE